MIKFLPVVMAYCDKCGAREMITIFPKVKTWWHECNQGNIETRIKL